MSNFILLYARFGVWETENHVTNQGAISAAIDGFEFEEIFPIAITDCDAKTFEILRTTESWRLDQSRIERYLTETMGEKFSCTGDLWIDGDSEDDETLAN